MKTHCGPDFGHPWLKGTMRGKTDFVILGLNDNSLNLNCDFKNTVGELLRIVLPGHM